MQFDKARELLATQASFGGVYNRNAARLILIHELRLDEVFGLEPGTDFSNVVKQGRKAPR